MKSTTFVTTKDFVVTDEYGKEYMIQYLKIGLGQSQVISSSF